MLTDLRRDAARLRNAERLTYRWKVAEAVLFDNGFQAVVHEVLIGANCVVTRDAPAGSKVLPRAGIRMLPRRSDT